MSSAFLHKQVSLGKAKKRAYAAFSIYLRTLWTLAGFVPCYTCDKHVFLKGTRPGERVMVGHWVEGHSAITYINEDYVRPQCFRCNMMMGGNQGEFRDRIRKEIGDAKTDELLALAKTSVKYTATDYLQKEAFYKEKLSLLTNNQPCAIVYRL